MSVGKPRQRLNAFALVQPRCQALSTLRGAVLTNSSGVHAEKGSAFGAMAILMLIGTSRHATNQRRRVWEATLSARITGKTVFICGLDLSEGLQLRASSHSMSNHRTTPVLRTPLSCGRADAIETPGSEESTHDRPRAESDGQEYFGHLDHKKESMMRATISQILLLFDRVSSPALPAYQRSRDHIFSSSDFPLIEFRVE